ncbi:hypothetical protein [Hydrogenophaga crassostreae]|uniref:hypothetical protein n=1 Tax=Hydrogenophaga crassostreae TaxID=1763535 RepID=UPI0012FD2843|nr:hypothetical protein [Hydrogenophaga crassostreae]
MIFKENFYSPHQFDCGTQLLRASSKTFGSRQEIFSCIHLITPMLPLFTNPQTDRVDALDHVGLAAGAGHCPCFTPRANRTEATLSV